MDHGTTAQPAAPHARAFLARCSPFDALTPEQLDRVCAGTGVITFAAGAPVMVEDAVPTACLYVVHTGAVELLHDSEVIDVLEPGECFGHTSLLTGMAPVFSVRVREDSECFTIEPAAALIALGTAAGVRWVALADRERLTRTGHTVHALPQMDTTRVGSLVLSPPLFCEPDTSIRSVAQTLTARADTAALVQTPSGLGIVTDAELRAHVVAGDVPLDAPVSQIARVPLPAVPADELAIDATIDMLDAGVDHLAVLGDDGRPLGVISAQQPRRAWTRTVPLRCAMRSSPPRMSTASSTRRSRRAPCSAGCCDAGLSSSSLSRVLTLQSDAITDVAEHLDRATRTRARAVGLADARQRGAARVHARIRPGQCAGLRRRRRGRRPLFRASGPGGQ